MYVVLFSASTLYNNYLYTYIPGFLSPLLYPYDEKEQQEYLNFLGSLNQDLASVTSTNNIEEDEEFVPFEEQMLAGGRGEEVERILFALHFT